MILITTHIVKKSDIGFHGNLFGGELLSWVDISAAAYVMEICHNRRMVTVSIDKCEFKKPAKESSLVKIYAEVIKIGTTSITLSIEARAFNAYTHNEDKVLTANTTFVRIDEEGTPIPISDKVRDEINLMLKEKSSIKPI